MQSIIISNTFLLSTIFVFSLNAETLNYTQAILCADDFQNCAYNCSSKLDSCLNSLAKKAKDSTECYQASTAYGIFQNAFYLTVGSTAFSALILPGIITILALIARKITYCQGIYDHISGASEDTTSVIIPGPAGGTDAHQTQATTIFVTRFLKSFETSIPSTVSAISIGWAFDFWNNYNQQEAICEWTHSGHIDYNIVHNCSQDLLNCTIHSKCTQNWTNCLRTSEIPKLIPKTCYEAKASKKSFQYAIYVAGSVLALSIFIVPMVSAGFEMITQKTGCCAPVTEEGEPLSVSKEEPKPAPKISKIFLQKLTNSINAITTAAISCITVSWLYALWKSSSSSEASCTHDLNPLDDEE